MRHAGESGAQLPNYDRLGFPGLTLLEQLANTEQRSESPAIDCRALESCLLVRLSENVSPLGVANERNPRACITRHANRHFAGERTLIGPEDILHSEQNVAPVGD